MRLLKPVHPEEFVFGKRSMMDFIRALVWLFKNKKPQNRRTNDEILIFPEIPRNNNNGNPTNNGMSANLAKSALA